MSSKYAVGEVSMLRGLAAAIAALWIGGGGQVAAETLRDPPVFASRDGVLDIMMIEMPQPIPTISFTPPGGATLHPTGWVYQVCPRPLSGLSCPSSNSTVSPYGG